MDIADHRVVADELTQILHRRVGIPEFVEAVFDRRWRIFEQRGLIRRPEGAPLDVFVDLVQHMIAHLRHLGLGIL